MREKYPEVTARIDSWAWGDGLADWTGARREQNLKLMDKLVWRKDMLVDLWERANVCASWVPSRGLSTKQALDDQVRRMTSWG